MISFVIPGKPVGVNEAYAPARWGKRHGFMKTPACEAFQDRIILAARQEMRRLGWKSIEEKAGVNIRYYFNTLASDIDGPLKPTLDAVAKAGVVWNDNRVRELHVFKLDPDGNPRTEIDVYPGVWGQL